jgi:hypothetical protein
MKPYKPTDAYPERKKCKYDLDNGKDFGLLFMFFGALAILGILAFVGMFSILTNIWP